MLNWARCYHTIATPPMVSSTTMSGTTCSSKEHPVASKIPLRVYVDGVLKNKRSGAVLFFQSGREYMYIGIRKTGTVVACSFRLWDP